LTILIGIFSINDVFAASQVTITPVSGSSSPGCETSGGCYSPSIATVDVGGTVIFSNTDTAAHTFTSGTAADGPSGAFDSSLVIAGSSYEWKPTTAGSFPYDCLVHPWMSGLIVVQEAGGNSSYTQSSISVTTDKSKYVNGDVISITGKIVGQSSGIPVALRVVAPNGNLVTVVILDVNSNNKFSTQLIAGGALMKSGGTYTVTAIYGTENISAKTTFTFAGSIGGTPTSPTIQVTGTDFMVNYKITGGKIISITPDVEAHSIIISLSASQDGTLVITLPRSLIDAKMSSQDDSFFILVNGVEVDFEETATSTDRTLTIQFPTRAQEIEIIGTSVYSNSNNYPQPTPYTPTPSTPVRIPAGMNSEYFHIH